MVEEGPIRSALGPGLEMPRRLRKRRLWNKHVKYLWRYEAAFMDGADEVPDRSVTKAGEKENA